MVPQDVIAILGAMDRQNAEDLSVTVALAARPGVRTGRIGIAWHWMASVLVEAVEGFLLTEQRD